MFTRSVSRQTCRSVNGNVNIVRHETRRTLIAAPKPNSGPLMERRADRALPQLPSRNRWMKTLPIFLVGMAGSSLAIFNYQKSNSSVVASTMYALRKHPEARQILGDEIYFAHQIPWIFGTINQLHGHIDISFSVKGTKSKAMMRFQSERRTRMGYFDTTGWTLTTEDGRVISLLDNNAIDPFPQDEASAAFA